MYNKAKSKENKQLHKWGCRTFFADDLQRVLKGIPWESVNDIYTIFEQATKQEDKKVLIESQDLADDLYKEILK